MKSNNADQTAQREMQDLAISQALSKVKNAYLIMSGKGGVGKSSIAVNLAAELASSGYKVGLLDVDLHGPSIPKMLGIEAPSQLGNQYANGLPQKTITFFNDQIIPARHSSGLLAVSIDCLLENNDEAIIWRGPRKISAIRQFLSDVRWGELDYLIVDSPPGTGDEPLTIAQTIPGIKSIIVTTPQEVSLRDVRKSINFCRTIHMDITGVIENMSIFLCPHCGQEADLFKSGGGEIMALQMNVPFLGKIPIIPEMVAACDEGRPAIISSNKVKECFTPVISHLHKQDNATPAISGSQSPLEEKQGADKIAVPLADGKLCAHFGHCSEFALIDVDSGEKKILNKEVIEAPEHQPGLLPKWLAEKGATVIIAGGMGSRAQSLFKEKNIKVVTGALPGNPEKIITDYLHQRLKVGENICDH